MKIVIPTPTYFPDVNGASYFAQRLAYYLTKRGHEVLVIAPGPSMRTTYYKHNGATVFGLASFPLKGIRISIPFFLGRKIKKAVLKFKPDIVHLQTHFAPGRKTFVAAKKLGIPVMGTNHFMPENLTHYLHLPQVLENLLNKLSWDYFLYTYNRLPLVTAPSQTAGNLLNNVGVKKDIRVVSNGIDMAIFNPAHQEGDFKKNWGLPEKPILLYVGRLDKEKHVEWILQALKKFVGKLDIHLVVAGKGLEQNYLKSLTKKLNLGTQVTFLGFVPDQDLPALYANSDCYIIPGVAELQSISTMEAMASGLPVIAVRAMALPELVKDGENGLLFESENIEALSNCIYRIFSNQELRKKMGATSLNYIRPHNIENIIYEFEVMYEKALQTL